MKSRAGQRQREEKDRREKSRRERVRRKKIQMREKVGKSQFTMFFQWFVAPEGRKVGSLKRRVRSQLARWEMNNCTPLWREAHFQVKMYKTHQCRTTFGSCDVEKVHAVVARSTFPSQNVQNTPVSDHFWKLRCRKSARRCGAKHISKSKCTKHTSAFWLGNVLRATTACTFSTSQLPKVVRHWCVLYILTWKCALRHNGVHFFDIATSKSGPTLVCFVHFDLEMCFAPQRRALFRHRNFQKWSDTPVSDHFWKLRCRKSARRCGAKHISKSKCTKHTSVGPLLEVAMSKKCTPLWREAHFQVKMYKTPHVRATFGGSDVEKVHAVVARSTFRSQKSKKLRVLSLFWR